jgi:hypothetical protein
MIEDRLQPIQSTIESDRKIPDQIKGDPADS